MSETCTTTITITANPGMDAPVAARFARTAGRFDCDILVHYRGATANGKSIIGLLSLCARHGEMVKVVADGADAREALDALDALFRPAVNHGGHEQPSARVAAGTATRRAAPNGFAAS